MRSRAPWCVIVAISLVWALSAPAAHAAVEAVPPVSGVIDTAVAQNASWIEQSVRPDGAIATGPDKQFVSPYLANFAVMGLARAAAAGDGVAARVGWRWLSWYQSHEDAHGYVHDYGWVGPILVSNDRMDSTDAYAGTFLSAVEAMHRATHDDGRVAALQRGIEGAVRAIESTQDVDGLTWATPTWHVKYLMDEAETYAGLMAASRMAGVADDPSTSLRAAVDGHRMRVGVDGMWNSAIGAYDWAIDGRGIHTTTDWSVLYPDAMQQAWAVAFGLVDAARARGLLNTLALWQPRWSSPLAISQFDSGPGRVGYWPAATWALRRVGADLVTPIDAMQRAARTTNRAWPFTTAVAGQLMVAEAPPLLPPA